MASKRNQRRKACERKRKYLTMDEAVQDAMVLRKKNLGHVLDAYQCGHCGAWHVGHRPKKVRDALANKHRGRK